MALTARGVRLDGARSCVVTLVSGPRKGVRVSVVILDPAGVPTVLVEGRP